MKVLPIENEPGCYLFECPGCKHHHKITPDWQYNGNPEKPTISPSVLVRNGHYLGNEGSTSNGECWCSYNKAQLAKGESPAPFDCTVCHSFVRDGKIQFLSDCTHALAGQTVELPELD